VRRKGSVSGSKRASNAGENMEAAEGQAGTNDVRFFRKRVDIFEQLKSESKKGHLKRISGGNGGEKGGKKARFVCR